MDTSRKLLVSKYVQYLISRFDDAHQQEATCMTGSWFHLLTFKTCLCHFCQARAAPIQTKIQIADPSLQALKACFQHMGGYLA